ncbi:MAG: hypothetical protein AB1815_05890 [Bacillota bacterium]
MPKRRTANYVSLLAGAGGPALEDDELVRAIREWESSITQVSTLRTPEAAAQVRDQRGVVRNMLGAIRGLLNAGR